MLKICLAQCQSINSQFSTALPSRVWNLSLPTKQGHCDFLLQKLTRSHVFDLLLLQKKKKKNKTKKIPPFASLRTSKIQQCVFFPLPQVTAAGLGLSNLRNCVTLSCFRCQPYCPTAANLETFKPIQYMHPTTLNKLPQYYVNLRIYNAMKYFT